MAKAIKTILLKLHDYNGYVGIPIKEIKNFNDCNVGVNQDKYTQVNYVSGGAVLVKESAITIDNMIKETQI